MRTSMWLEGLGNEFLIGDFVLGGVRGSNAMSGSYGLCKFDGSCVADINVTRSADRISAKLMRACVTGKNFATGKISATVDFGNESGRRYARYYIYLLDVRVIAAVQEKMSEEKISFICSDAVVDYG
ncbi:MAG: type VI secretion system tube protein Hcp [Pyrinomonadaceae bacterium]